MFWPVVINDMIWWTMYVWRSWLKNKNRTRSKNTTGRIDFQKREKGKVNFNAWPDLHHEKACETKKWETKKIFVNRPNFFILPQAIATSQCWKPTANVPAAYPCWQLRPKSQDETMTKPKWKAEKLALSGCTCSFHFESITGITWISWISLSSIFLAGIRICGLIHADRQHCSERYGH